MKTKTLMERMFIIGFWMGWYLSEKSSFTIAMEQARVAAKLQNHGLEEMFQSLVKEMGLKEEVS